MGWFWLPFFLGSGSVGIWVVPGWLVRCKIMPLTAGTWHISPGPGEQHHLAGRRRNKPAPLLTNRGQGNNEANQLRGLGELTAENKINIFYGATFRVSARYLFSISILIFGNLHTYPY